MGAVKTMEEKMRLLTYLELSRYTHAQLWELQRQMLVALPELGEGSIERENAMMNIRHIRIFLARRSYTLG
jgi:hypothetical protein